MPVPAVSQHSAAELGGLLTAQRQAARDADWAALLPGSLTLLGAGEGHGTAVRAVRASTGALAALGTGAAEALREGLEQLAARSDHGAQAQGIREQLQATNPDLAVRAGPLLDQVAAGAIDAGPFEEATEAAAGLGQAPGTELETALCVAATTRGLLGLVHAVINTAQPRTPGVAGFEVELAGLQEASTQVADTLRDAELGLFSACVGSGGHASVLAAAAALAARVHDLLVPFAAQQARGAALVAALRAAGRNSDAERVGAVLARDGWLVRRAVADAAVAARLRLDLVLPQAPPNVSGLLDAHGARFDAVLPDGRNTQVAHLGPGDDGDLVQVGGFVTATTAAREPDGKLVGRMSVQDPSSGATVEVAAVFLHPAHIGITLDSYVDIHGVYRVASARLDGGPGVEVDTLAPAGLAQESWQARLWFAAAPWIDVWRSNLHLTWSLGTHTAGPDDSDDPTRGAAELIYAPFAREET